MVRVQLQPAYLLHHRPYRDTSLLLEVFSRDHGRIGLVARGVRGGKSRRAALLQPFRPLLLSWSGRGELATLGEAEADGMPLPLAGVSLISGLYLNELLVRTLARHDPHEALFLAYDAALRELAVEGEPEPVLRLFERFLLDQLGYGLVLDHSVDDGRPLEAGRRYCYRLESGPVAESGEEGGESGVPIGGGALLALASGELGDRGQWREIKRLMRAALAPLLGGRPLKSRELFRLSDGARRKT